MKLSNGRIQLSLPGPTPLPQAVLSAMQRQPVDIYDPELMAISVSCRADLAALAGSTGDVHLYAANGHGAWEAALVNTLSPGDTVLVCESGRFAEDWGEMASDMGLNVQSLPGSWSSAVNAEALREKLARDTSGAIKAVLATQIDTASSVHNDVEALGRAIRDAGHAALFMVDIIGSFASTPFEMDNWGVDVAVGSSQKGLMCPPGLSFTIAGEKAKAAHETAALPRHYWDWTKRNRAMHYFQYCGTPPEHHLFALRAALDLIQSEGIEAVYGRHRHLAGAVRAAAQHWTSLAGGDLQFCIDAPLERSDAVTTLTTSNENDPQALFDLCQDELGVTLGLGIGALRGKAIRLAHMGHVNAPMILGALSCVELGMVRLGWKIERGGVQAAIDHLAAL